jgi:DNA-directed RNA polymerase III subunit RPC8
VLNVGLCIVLHDLTYVGDSYIFPGDGASHTKGTILLLSVIFSSFSILHERKVGKAEEPGYEAYLVY